MSDSQLDFSGTWIGQSMDIDTSPAHLWRITQRDSHVFIYTRWEGQSHDSGYFSATVAGSPPGFEMNGYSDGRGRAIWLDTDHFMIIGWDTNDIRGKTGPDFDVVFSRQGLAELSARAVYLRARNTPHG
jgi:hypothetical protein